MDASRLRARELRNQSTDAERCLWRHLRLHQLAGLKFRRQAPIAGYIADFVCPQVKLIIEVDGGQHVEQADADEIRTQILKTHGYRVIRYWNDDVLSRIEDVLDDILRHAKGTPPRPSPSLCEREGAKGSSE